MVDPDIFNDVPIFSLLDAEERKVLAQQVSAHNFVAGQTIFSAGDPGTYAYLVQQGKVHVSITDLADETIIVDVCENGGLLGMSSLLAQAEHLTTAVASPGPASLQAQAAEQDASNGALVGAAGSRADIERAVVAMVAGAMKKRAEDVSLDAGFYDQGLDSTNLLELEHMLAGGWVRLRIVCSAGFYVRSLAQDLGQVLGCGAHLEALRRTRAGRFGIDRAVTAESLASNAATIRDRWIGTNELLGHLGAVTVSEEGARRVAHGNTVSPNHIVREEGLPVDSGHTVRLLDGSGAVLAIAERRAGLGWSAPVRGRPSRERAR